MTSYTRRDMVNRQIHSRLRLSKYVQRGLLGIAIAAGLAAGPSEGLGEDPLAAVAWSIAGASAAAGAIERPLAVRRCRRIVGKYASHMTMGGQTSSNQGLFPVVLSVEDGELHERTSYDKQANENTNVTAGITRSVVRASSDLAGFMGGYFISRTARGEVTAGMEPLVYGLGGLMLACTIGVEFAEKADQRQLEQAFARQLDNIDRGPSFEVGATT